MKARLGDNSGTRRVEVDTGAELVHLTASEALHLAVQLIDAVATDRLTSGEGCERGHHSSCRHQGGVWVPS